MHGAQREPEQKERGDDAGKEYHDHCADKGPEVGRTAAPACGQHLEGGEGADDHDGSQHRVGDEGDPVRKTHQDHQHRVEVEQRGLGVQRLRHGGTAERHAAGDGGKEAADEVGHALWNGDYTNS